MKHLPVIIVLLCWYALTGYVVYTMFTTHHPVWGVVLAIVMGGAPEVKQRTRVDV